MQVGATLFTSTAGRRPGLCAVMADALARAGSEGGTVLLEDAIELAVDQGKASDLLLNRDGERYVTLWRRFGKFMLSLRSRPVVADVTQEAVAKFVHAWTSYEKPAGTPTKRLRLSAVRALFRVLRDLRIASADPSIDIRLPPRVEISLRPFTEDEIERCRWHALATTCDTRRPAVWALMEAGASTGEVGLVRVGHLSANRPELWIPGGPKTRPRQVPLNAWSHLQLRRRAAFLDCDPNRSLAATVTGTHDEMRNATTATLRTVIRAAGFGPDPLVGATSITSWLARSVLNETGRIEEVARRLGLRSLDRAAGVAHWDWSES